jgi:hypothetical protein
MINLIYKALVTELAYIRVEDGWDVEEVNTWEWEHGGVFLTEEELAKALVRLAPAVAAGRVKEIETYE